jgi:hypothetical protein
MDGGSDKRFVVVGCGLFNLDKKGDLRMRNQGRHALILLVTTMLAFLSCAACNREKTPIEEVTPEPEETTTASDLEPVDTELVPPDTELGSIEPTPMNDDSGSVEPSTSPSSGGESDVFACTCNTYENGVLVSSRQISRGERCGEEVCE